jgi:hypothetical protein
MKLSSGNLEAVRGLLVKASSQLDDQTKVAKAAEESRAALAARVRSLQGSFDICAAGYAQDIDLSEGQLDALPADVQGALGYTKPKLPAPVPLPVPAPAPPK